MVTNITTNRLINEKSPYLLQHAHNPVDWYPWSEKAFEKAKMEDKPVFLSIGYSTCHWCHVMERESFEDEKVAEILNEHFISIKADREERPDIDNIYMNFCQAMTGHGGWPLTIIMTPDKKPFFAGTYIPKKSKYGRKGLIELLTKVKEMWHNEKNTLINSSNQILNAIKNSIETKKTEDIGEETVHRTYNEFDIFYDSLYGGFGQSPKFPTPHNLLFLLRYYKAYGKKTALEMVEKTLVSMYKGGIFDHVGYGFARYSVDNKWLVPHFEKMLYDNALLAIAYTEAYQVTGNNLFKEIVEKIFTYVFREMMSEEGGFYSALDADSEGEEGKFYLWTVEEIESVLGEEDGKLYCKYYDISERGNFEGKNIPNLIKTNLKNIEKDKELKNKLESLNKKLYNYRERRVHPHKDDKILTAWNGLMIAALSIASRVFNNEEYKDSAEKAVDFIYNKLISEDGRLLARYRDGEAAYNAYLDDYAFLTWGLMELYTTTFKVEYLEKAIELTESMIELFWDEGHGGFYLNGKDSEQLVVRPKEVYDGAIPSGNSVAALNMLKLSKMIGDTKLEEKVDIIFKVFANKVKKAPNGYSYFMLAVLFSNVSVKEIVIVGDKEDTKEMLKILNKRFLPFATVVLNTGNHRLYHIAPFTKNQEQINNKATAYICEDFTCNEPTNEIEVFKKLLEYKKDS
ncbi:thioredoxin domain-containing protein [Caldisalinibacter kiritimatiensis]|uniref:Thymidylate kinase n=1 Tax=Caldisalinibacter kiritimatiensis TaxID=1304284 RepID=R1AQU1_9FIRM|nr:thioredoxin domain-containing protein [Caldisalinibacter kiritimatiensis]EOC99482.1 Thymidylate kinase [Caldisalinibacter kiritimatiensis]